MIGHRLIMGDGQEIIINNLSAVTVYAAPFEPILPMSKE